MNCHDKVQTITSDGDSYVAGCCVQRLADQVADDDSEFLDRLSRQ